MPRIHNARNAQELNRGSIIKADPRLQSLDEAQARSVIKYITKVADTQRDIFTPKTESNYAKFVMVAAVVAGVVLGALALVAALTGIGFGLMVGVAVGGFVLSLALSGLAHYMNNRAIEKAEKQKDVEDIHEDASFYRMSKNITEEQEMQEIRTPQRDRFARNNANVGGYLPVDGEENNGNAAVRNDVMYV